MKHKKQTYWELMNPSKKQNCWEFKRCGREPGGDKASELGVCPAAFAGAANGIHGGKNAGRACWAIAGTFCDGNVQGSFANKRATCLECEFYQRVQDEEWGHFQLIGEIMRRLKLAEAKE